ncbi:hypothetical protein BH11MYX2_BH11MYX2_08280 [soil metagenome]
MADVRLPLLTAALLLAGCLGDVPTGGNTGGGTDAGSGSSDAAASAAWTSMIVPIVTSSTHNCANASGCHGTGTTQPPKLTTYAEFKASGPAIHPAGEYLKPWASNLINTKTATLGTPPMHQSLPWLSTTELATFKTFIDTYGM